MRQRRPTSIPRRLGMRTLTKSGVSRTSRKTGTFAILSSSSGNVLNANRLTVDRRNVVVNAINLVSVDTHRCKQAPYGLLPLA